MEKSTIITTVTDFGIHIERATKHSIACALKDTRVVSIQGARQTGKSTLAKKFISSSKDLYLTMDTASVRESAQANLSDFVRQAPDGLLIIDEIQRVPDLILEIKEVVDSSERPGQFLIIGSSDLSELEGIQESLAGRMERTELMPISQQEIQGSRSNFICEVFEEIYKPKAITVPLTRQDYLEHALCGGYPEALYRNDKRRRDAWFDNYVRLLFEQQVSEEKRKIDRLLYMRFFSYLASISGKELVIDSISNDLKIKRYGVEQMVSELQRLFLVEVLPAWSTNLTNRAIKHPKVFLKDSGLLARLMHTDVSVTTDLASTTAGSLFETFIFNELLRMFSASENYFDFYHYRDARKREVDIVIEDDHGRVLLVEVKASSTVKSADFGAINYLMQKHPKRIVRGLVIYTGNKILPFGERQLALPAQYLWE